MFSSLLSFLMDMCLLMKKVINDECLTLTLPSLEQLQFSVVQVDCFSRTAHVQKELLNELIKG